MDLTTKASGEALPPNARRITGRTVSEAMQKATQEFGPDVMICGNPRRISGKGGMLGGFLGGGDEMVELMVVPDTQASAAPESGIKAPGNTLLAKTYGNSPASPGGISLQPNRSARSSRTALEPAAEVSKGFGRGLEARLDEMAQALRDSFKAEVQALAALQARGGLPAVHDKLLAMYRHLVARDVSERLARKLVEHLQDSLPGDEVADPERLVGAVCRRVGQLLKTTGPIQYYRDRPAVIALIGATGVGKTMTVGKLAVAYGIDRQQSPAILNLDGLRPGADAQLTSLNRFMGMPVESAATRDTACAILDDWQDRELILLDTPGCVPGDDASMRDLAATLKAIRPDETHLVISATTGESTARQMLERFKPCGYDRILVTKLDEAPTPGLLLTLAPYVGRGYSYVTEGRAYTDRAVTAVSTVLAKQIVDRPGERGGEE